MLRLFYSTSAAPRLCRAIAVSRYYSQAPAPSVRDKMLAEVKQAMKAKDTFTSTLLRSVLAEVYAGDKNSKSGKIDDSAVVDIVRKAITRRRDAAGQYLTAERRELADHETREAKVLDAFLPTLLTAEEIDKLLSDVIDQIPQTVTNKKQAMGNVFKLFTPTVDKSVIDQKLLRERAEIALDKVGRFT